MADMDDSSIWYGKCKIIWYSFTMLLK